MEELALDFAKKFYGDDLVGSVEKITMWKGNNVYRINTTDTGAIGIIYFVLIDKIGEPRISTDNEYFEILEKIA